MNILVLAWRDLAHPSAGGAEVYTHQVARRWVRDGHAVTLFCAAVTGRPDTEAVDGVQVMRRGSQFSVYREAESFYRRCPPGSFDVVIDEVNTRPFFAPRFVRDAPVTALIFQLADEIWHHEVPWPLAWIGRRWIEPRWLQPYSDVPVLTISESSRASLHEAGLRRVSVVPVGLEVVERPLPQKEKEPTALFVGRLAANKRPAHAIAAFERARQSVPEAAMWIIGTGPLEKKLRRQHRDVTFFGRVDEDTKYELMARAHVLLAPSVREGWGMVVSEAAAVGTTTIAYDVPGLRDSVRAAGGVLVAPRIDSLGDELARRLPALAGGASSPSGAGVATWDEVATAIMGHLRASFTSTAQSTNEERL